MDRDRLLAQPEGWLSVHIGAGQTGQGSVDDKKLERQKQKRITILFLASVNHMGRRRRILLFLWVGWCESILVRRRILHFLWTRRILLLLWIDVNQDVICLRFYTKNKYFRWVGQSGGHFTLWPKVERPITFNQLDYKKPSIWQNWGQNKLVGIHCLLTFGYSVSTLKHIHSNQKF